MPAISAPPRDHAAIGLQYARDVVAGHIPACLWVRLACQRSLDDLARQDTPGFRYRFDADLGGRVCRFAECLPLVDGPLARDGALLVCQPWQCWVLTQVFGWVCSDGPREGKRRFRTVYLEMPRGSTKSATSSAVALYMLACDNEAGAQIVTAAKSRDMAKIVMRTAQQMARKSPALMKKLGVEVTAHGIHVLRTASRFETVASETGGNEGRNLHLAVADEIHTMGDRDLLDSLVTGMAKRDQSLLWQITTSGSDRSSICYEVNTYVRKLLQRVVCENSYFGCIWSIDDEDLERWYEPEVIQRANPSWQVSVQPDVVIALAQKALVTPSFQSAFKQRHLCVWTNANDSWMNMAAWDRCRDPDMCIDDFAGERAFVGLDLASKIDICAKVLLFPKMIDNVLHYYLFGTYWLPDAALRDGRNSQYLGWSSSGKLSRCLSITEGDVLDFAVVEESLLHDSREFQIEAICYDPWQALMLATRMITEHGAPMRECRQVASVFSPAMKELEALVMAGRLHHNDPILDWMISNVTCFRDYKDNISPRKETYANKIDGAIAGLMALSAAMTYMPEDDAPMIAFV